MKKIYLLAPDKGSGKAFEKKFIAKSIIPILHYYKIPPRVLGDEVNSSISVTNSFEQSLRESFKHNLPVAIACNTLQFWLTKVHKSLLKHGTVVTTFEACKHKFESNKNKPVWLGTTPTAKLVRGFPTLYKLKRMDIQSKVQELIWRIKKINGDDISSSPRVVRLVKESVGFQKKYVINLRDDILDGLKSAGIKRVILGCTELPIVFHRKKQMGIIFYDPAEILADFVKTNHL